MSALQVIGGFSIIAGVFVALYFANEKWEIWHKLGYPFRVGGDMISSLYNNMCPLVTWD